MERTYTTPLLDKLGIRPGFRVALVRITDPDIRNSLATRTSDVIEAADVIDGAPAGDVDIDVVLLGADTEHELAQLAAWRSRIRPSGAIWVVSRKGRTATLRDIEVIAAARAAGLVDNKVAAFSATHTALRLVIPGADRPR
ncbi:MAG: DUF3052 family protein [Chloroflexi bacterium]|nr:DUF3052 family protein [Chloroflexota bacterium]